MAKWNLAITRPERKISPNAIDAVEAARGDPEMERFIKLGILAKYLKDSIPGAEIGAIHFRLQWIANLVAPPFSQMRYESAGEARESLRAVAEAADTLEKALGDLGRGAFTVLKRKRSIFTENPNPLPEDFEEWDPIGQFGESLRWLAKAARDDIKFIKVAGKGEPSTLEQFIQGTAQKRLFILCAEALKDWNVPDHLLLLKMGQAMHEITTRKGLPDKTQWGRLTAKKVAAQVFGPYPK